MKLPRKELLSAVLNIEVKDFDIMNEILFFNENGSLNIYELMHLMKEWALDLDYVIASFREHTGDCFANVSSGIIVMETKSFRWQSEFEAVVQACEWILKESK